MLVATMEYRIQEKEQRDRQRAKMLSKLASCVARKYESQNTYVSFLKYLYRSRAHRFIKMKRISLLLGRQTAGRIPSSAKRLHPADR